VVRIVGNLDTIGSIAASQLDFALFQILYLATAEGAQGDESASNRINKLRVINVDHWYESLSLRHFRIGGGLSGRSLR